MLGCILHLTRSRKSNENPAKMPKVYAGAKVVSGESSKKASDDIEINSDTELGQSHEEK